MWEYLRLLELVVVGGSGSRVVAGVRKWKQRSWKEKVGRENSLKAKGRDKVRHQKINCEEAEWANVGDDQYLSDI